MRRFRPTNLVLGVLALAAIGKVGQWGVNISNPDADAVSVFSLASPVAAAGSEPAKEEIPAESEAYMCEQPEAVFAEIARERDLLAKQSSALVEQEARLQIGQQKLSTDADELRELKASLEEILMKVEEKQNEDLDRLVNLYRNMKPRAAADIINDMDIESSVLVLGTMPERDAAPILALIDAVRARAISKIIIERSKLPGDQDFSGLRLR